jgi:RimJ/RimL family protein N-acetyltransferase
MHRGMKGSPRDIRLRLPEDNDLNVLGKMREDTELQNLLLAYPEQRSSDDLYRWLERRRSEPGGTFLVIADTGTNECLGYAQIADVHGKGRYGALGIALADAARGAGVGHAAVQLLLEHAREKMELRKIELEVMATNHRAISLYRKVGFEDVGVRRKHYYDGTVWHDVLVMEVFLGDARK